MPINMNNPYANRLTNRPAGTTTAMPLQQAPQATAFRAAPTPTATQNTRSIGLGQMPSGWGTPPPAPQTPAWQQPGQKLAGTTTGTPFAYQNAGAQLQQQGVALPQGYGQGYNVTDLSNLGDYQSNWAYVQPYQNPAEYEQSKQNYDSLMSKDWQVTEQEKADQMKSITDQMQPGLDFGLQSASEQARARGLENSGLNFAAGSGLMGDVYRGYNQGLTQASSQINAAARIEEERRKQQLYNNVTQNYQSWQNQMNTERGLVEAHQNDDQQFELMKAQLAQQQQGANAGMWGALGSTVGGLAGSFAGPLGSMAGSWLGGQAGNYGSGQAGTGSGNWWDVG